MCGRFFTGLVASFPPINATLHHDTILKVSHGAANKNKTNKFCYRHGRIETISHMVINDQAYLQRLIWPLNQIHPRNGVRHVFTSSANYKLLLISHSLQNSINKHATCVQDHAIYGAARFLLTLECCRFVGSFREQEFVS